MNKRISILLPSLGGGGAEKVMVALANNFVEKKYDVDILLVSNEGVYFDLLSTDVRVIDLNASRSLFAIPKLIRYIKKYKPNVLLSILTHTNIVALICKIIFQNKIKVIISERSILSKQIMISNSFLFKNIKFFLHFLYPLADSIIAISNGVAEDLIKTLKINKEKVKIIYNPLTYNYDIDSNKVVDKNFFPFNNNNSIIISVGRLAKVKNHELLIMAFSLLRKRRNARLIILGEGPERPMLSNLIKTLHLDQDVFLLGFVDNPLDYMSKSDVFVLSSNWEGFGNVLVEAMSLGLKLVSTDCPSGPREILENGKWGKLVPVNNAELLAKAIDDILDENIIYDVKERAAHFSIEKIATKYLEVMKI